jgi:HEAT repeat protein
MASIWGKTPRQSIEAESGRRGEHEVVSGCLRILDGDTRDADLLLALGGPGAEQVLAGRAGGLGGYWPRVWATRALLYVWDDRAVPAVIGATADPSWRVREMALKVIARHTVGEAVEEAARLQDDPVARVRQAASRSLVAITAARA